MRYVLDEKLSRKHLSNPTAKTDLYDHLKKTKAVDLRGNSEYVDFGNGYGMFEAIDIKKTF